jgi:hypothetical protein
MRWWALVLPVVLACSTDTFVGDDGGEGGVNDGGGDSSQADVLVGEGGTADANNNCLNGGQTSNCGNNGWCTGETCCATEGGAQCTNNSCNGTTFSCRNTADCATADAGILTCCLNNATITPDVCPRGIKGGQSACTSLCAGYKLCSSSSECGGAKLCERASIGGAANGITVGICL